MKSAIIILALGFAMLSSASSPVQAQSLKGSRASVDIQNRVAQEHEFTFTATTAQVKRFVNAGYLVPVRGSADVFVKQISHPYARPEVALFIERLGRQYRAACGEQLVITSLTRPANRQPRNASSRSVHPTGMAMDVRRSSNRGCRSWLEKVLLRLEGAGVIEATRENRPPHYHIAVFPSQYAEYVDRKLAGEVEETRLAEYRVRSGDSLWSIAERHGTSISDLRSVNDLRGSRIYAGQVLTVPTGRQLPEADELPAFLAAADISFIPEPEDHRVGYADERGARDLIEILADHGFNAIRLKLWHTPEAPCSTLDPVPGMARQQIAAQGVDSHWENAALFDFEGKALPGLDAPAERQQQGFPTGS